MKLSLDNLEAFLGKEGDWTVRLLNRSIPPPEQYLFALLWFRGDTGLWVAHFLEQHLRVISEESNREFMVAKQILIEKIGDFISKGYKITAVSSGYDIPPWLQRKR